MKGKVFLLVFLLAVAIVRVQGQGEMGRRVDSIVQAAISADLIPGAVVRIERDGKTIYNKAYGWSQKYDYNRRAIRPAPEMDTATLFDLASLTKVVGTTTSLMLLADRGQIHIDDTVSRYLPGFDTGSKRQVTIRHLLTHTAGLYEWYPLFYRSRHRDSTIRFVESLPLKYPVGRQRKYSDLGFMLLGAIVEKVSGMRLDVFEEENVFKPLGMSHTSYNPLEHGRISNIAATSLGNPYEYRMVHDTSLGFAVAGVDPGSWNGWRHYLVRGEVNDGNAWYASEGISGHAGLFSTIGDIQLLVNMLLNKGMNGDHRFISAAVVRDFLTPDGFRNGLGWMMDTANAFMKNAPSGSFGHTGFTGTSITVVPAYHLSIIILINRQNVGLQANGAYYNPNPIREGVFESVMDGFRPVLGPSQPPAPPATNLVPNPSFEDVNMCAEYAQPCSPSAWFFFSRHLTTGYYPQYPSATGSRHLQMVAASRETPNRQYWETMLLCPLRTGARYSVSMKIAGPESKTKLSSRCPNLHDIGLWFTDRWVFVDDDSVLQPRSFLSFTGASTTDLKNGWFEVKKEFTATSNSSILMVGNFSRMANADIMDQRDVKTPTIDILVDDIAVVPVDGSSCAMAGKIKDYLYAYTWRHSETQLPPPENDSLFRGPADTLSHHAGDTLSRRRDSLRRRVADTPRMVVRKPAPDTIIIHNIQFDFDQYMVQNPDTLKQYTRLLTRPGITKVRVVGFTDNVGSPEYNLDLSRKRAQEVARLLASKFNLDPALIETEGKGISADYPTRELNRRVEIYIYHE